ncbi:hypothetical protein DFH06DRAFT_1330946 [Mycena polygramma]|nr:hypothetical protein DFH06DRAFT_1330946 [Mycena polygramma]
MPIPWLTARLTSAASGCLSRRRARGQGGGAHEEHGLSVLALAVHGDCGGEDLLRDTPQAQLVPNRTKLVDSGVGLLWRGWLYPPGAPMPLRDASDCGRMCRTVEEFGARSPMSSLTLTGRVPPPPPIFAAFFES